MIVIQFDLQWKEAFLTSAGISCDRRRRHLKGNNLLRPGKGEVDVVTDVLLTDDALEVIAFEDGLHLLVDTREDDGEVEDDGEEECEQQDGDVALRIA